MKAPQTIPFNVNQYVRVRLTDTGRKVHAEHYQRHVGNVFPYQPPVEDADGWSKWQMWELANIFGGSMYIGCEVPFMPDIEIEVDEP